MKLKRVHSHYQKRINLLIDDKTIEIPANITMAVGKEKSVIQIR